MEEATCEFPGLPYFRERIFYQNSLPVKKLLTLVFTCWYGVLAAQNSTPQNSIAIVAGPNWVQKINSAFFNGNGKHASSIGYAIGAEYACKVAVHWEVKIGMRYTVLNSEYQSGYLRYESEYQPGGSYVPDPTLQHYFTIDLTDRVLQYLVGIRWSGKPKTWRWYADAETGLTDYIEPDGVPKANLRFTVGAGFGMAWQPFKSKVGIFAQPIVRYVFQDLGSDLSSVSYRFLIPAIEAGARYHF